MDVELVFQTEPAAGKELPAMQRSIVCQFKQILLNVRTVRSRIINRRRIIPVLQIMPILTAFRGINAVR
jgi:hypothetical protein